MSAAAVTALVTGIMSALALASPFFWIVPLIGIGAAWFALAEVSRPGVTKAGRSAALIGLALAVGFGTQAVSSTGARHWLTSSRARAAAKLWVEALRTERIDDAKSMCLSLFGHKVEQFSKRLAACGPDATIRLGDASLIDQEPEQWLVRAVVEPCVPGPVDLDIYLSKEKGVHGRFERWTVLKCDAR